MLLDSSRHSEKMEISNLSDELLVSIFAYVNHVDRISLAETCVRFNSILCDRKLIRNLNLASSYNVTAARLQKFLHPKLRCDHVLSLDLSSCYWLTSIEIMNCIKHLKRLKCLNVIDTELGFLHLKRILLSLPESAADTWLRLSSSHDQLTSDSRASPDLVQITHLSWSNMFSGQDLYKYGSDLWELSSRLASLEYLCFRTKNRPLVSICHWLSFCKNLRELRVLCIPQCGMDYPDESFIRHVPSFQLPHLHTIVLHVCRPDVRNSLIAITFVQILFEACVNNTSWKIFWFDVKDKIQGYTLPLSLINMQYAKGILLPFSSEALCSFLSEANLSGLKYVGLGQDGFPMSMDKRLCLENNLRDSNVTHVVWNGTPLIRLPRKLQHLTVSACCSENPDVQSITSLGSFDDLVSLSIPFCAFHQRRNHEPRQRRRLKSGIIVYELPPFRNSKLFLFSQENPNLQHLELTSCARLCNDFCYPTDLASLIHISEWKLLQSLSLDNIPIVDTSFLIKISQICLSLERLCLYRVGVEDRNGHMTNLVASLANLQNLKDFRLEQKNIGEILKLLLALRRCPLLQRVAILGERHIAPLNSEHCMQVLESCPRVVLFYICIPSADDSVINAFERKVKDRYKKSRPSLWAKMTKTQHNMELMPAIHHTEMIRHSNHLNVLP